MNKPALTFRVFKGSNLVGRETVRQEIVKIGRDAKSHLRVDDDTAARMHAVLEASPDQVTLIDLGNEPTTRVNGQRINKCALHAGDKIQIGAITFELEAIDAAPSLAADSPFANAPLFAPAPANPFLSAQPLHAEVPASPVLAVEQPAEEGEYRMLKSGPAVHPDEVEHAHVGAIEVKVLWGANVLHVAHLAAGRSFFVGESGEKGEASDFLLPSDVLGASRAALVAHRGASAWLVVPKGATGTVAMPNEASVPIAEFRAAGRARPSVELSGAHEIELLPGARARMQLEKSEIAFEVSAVNAGRKVAVGYLATLEGSAYKQIGASLMVHLGMVAAFAFFMPRMNLDDAEGIDRDFMARMLHAADAHQIDELERQDDVTNGDDRPTGGTGKQAEGAEGQMGNPAITAKNRRYSIAGPPDTSDPKLAREQALREAETFGMIRLISGTLNTPTAVWGENQAIGRDLENHLGSMWGQDIGDAFGVGGLGLSGNDEGGGGKWRGIGMGDIGTLGHGGGCIETPGKPCGIGFGPGGQGISHGFRPGREHQVTAKMPRQAEPTINGRLPAEVIQRIVRQNFGRFRMCYESGLRSNPSLQGRVAIKFVIARDGSVQMAQDGGSDMPDHGVVQCVARSFMNLSFPSPDGGVVTVVYPLVFNAE